MDEIYKIATNEDTIPLFDLRSMIHYSMGTPLPKTKIRLTNYRYYTPKYPSQVLTTPIILLKKILFSDYFQNKMTPLMRSKKVRGNYAQLNLNIGLVHLLPL